MDPEESSIERLKRTLYSRDEKVVPKERRTQMKGGDINVPTNWGEATTYDIKPEVMVKRNNSFFNKFLIGSLVFFFIAIGIAAFIFFGGWNMISSNNLDVKIVAPSSVSSGEDLLVGLTVVNGNRTDLENVTLFIEYPKGTLGFGTSTKPITREQTSLGTISKGGSKDYSIRAVLFGEKDSVKSFTLKLEYKVKGSNAVFSKEKTFDVTIGSSPILLNVDYPKEINSGQEVKLNIGITSNSNVVLSNSLVKIEYPYGFTYKSSNIKPLRDNSIWNIGDLKNGDLKNLIVTGVLVGQNMEDRTFRITSGTQSAEKAQDFDTTLVESSIVIGIRKSFFDLSVTSSSGLVAQPGIQVPVVIRWQNTLPDKILNGRVEATISGNSFDRSAVYPGNGGFYQSVDNMVLWDKNTTDILNDILPGEGGEVGLSMTSFGNISQNKLIKNPQVNIHVVMTGDRSGPDAGSVSSTEDFTVKILSTLALTSKTQRVVGPFANSGPIPPKADQESTYTVTWTLSNTTNDLKDGLVTAELPVGVVWKGETSPVSERINYLADSRLVTWNVGNISAGAGFNYSPKTASFKVGITPSINQIGAVPTLVTSIRASALDTFANSPVSASVDNATTQFSDPNFKFGDGTVAN